MHGQPAAESAADELAYAGDDGLYAVAEALQRVAEDHQEAQQNEQHTDDGQVLHRTVEDGRFGIAQHQAHGPALDQEDHDPCNGAVACLDDAAVPDALFDAVGAARTVVLANISCHSHADALHGQGEHLADLLTGGLRGHGHAAQLVNGVLHDDCANGRDRILKAHREADVGQPLAVPAGKNAVLFGEVDVLHFGEEPPGAEDAADELADHRRDGRALDAHAQRHDEQHIQRNVQEAGHQQEVERMLRVAQAAQNGGRIIVQHRRRDAQEDDADVAHGILQQLRRGVDELQQRGRNEGGDDRKDQTHHHAEHSAVEQVLVQIIPVLCAKALGHRDAEAVAGGQHEAHDHEVQRVGRAHCAQRIGADAAPHDDRVHKAVQLLEQRSQHQRQGELQNAGQRPADGQVGGAGTLFLCFLHKMLLQGL